MELYLHSFYVLFLHGQEQLHFSTQVYLALNLLVLFYVYLQEYAEALHSHLNENKKLTLNFMELNPSLVASRSSASQETLWNPKVHYSIHNNPPPVPVLSHINPAHASPSCFLNIHFNIILPSKPRPSQLSLSLRCPQPNPLCHSPVPHTCLMCNIS